MAALVSRGGSIQAHGSMRILPSSLHACFLTSWVGNASSCQRPAICQSYPHNSWSAISVPCLGIDGCSLLLDL